MNALPVGTGRDRLRLFDTEWRMFWDSATASSPAYRHIGTWIHAVIDYADGSRWVGQMRRCPEGIKRDQYPFATRYLEHLVTWPTFEAVS